MSTLTIASVQFCPSENVDDNLKRMVAHITQAAANGAQLVVFPEYSSWYTPELGPQSKATAQRIDGMFVTQLRKAAQRQGVAIVFGLIERLPQPETRNGNTVMAISSSGTIVSRYRKVHLYDAFGQRESDWIAPGKPAAAPVFTIGDITIGIQSCYDLRFPETTRWLVDAGAQVVLVPAAWIPGEHKVHHWKTLLAARAIENTIYVAAADQGPPNGVGHSCIIDANGETLAQQTVDEGIVQATIDTATLQQIRELNPVLQNRRFSVQPLPEAL